MKTKLIIPALLAFGMATGSLFAQSTEITKSSTEIHLTEDRVKLEPERLPDTIKENLSNDVALSGLQIVEAWQVTDEEGSFYYLVKFDDAGEEIEKKYNASGEEIED